MRANIFTYGSLMFPQVWERVVRGKYRSAPAGVAGYTRFAIAGESYPGMIAHAGGAVQGVVYFDVDALDLAALDAFEGDAYKRESLPARLASDELVMIDAYVFLDPRRLTALPWRPEAFQLQHFLESYCRDKLGQ